MKKILLIISLLLSSIFYTGCDNANSTNGSFTVTSGEKVDTLGTLGEEQKDLKKILSGENWKEITMDLDQFFATSISTLDKTYKIDLSFDNQEIIAYADCKKLTARYKINNTAISFSRISNEPDLDHATCQQSEDADQAVYQFLYNSFEASSIKENEITFKSDDFDAEVILKR